jgi:hypothetical protein
MSVGFRANGQHLSGFVNPAHPLPPGCNIKIKGIAPGASLAVLNVAGSNAGFFNSQIIQAIEHAVLVDHVNILNESFGGNPLPNTTDDPVSLADQAAVAAGVTVVVSSGTVNLAAVADTNPFDSAVSASSGDVWAESVNASAPYSPLTLGPGQSGTITLTITPNAPKGTVVHGFIAVDTFNLATLSGDELTASQLLRPRVSRWHPVCWIGSFCPGTDGHWRRDSFGIWLFVKVGAGG